MAGKKCEHGVAYYYCKRCPGPGICPCLKNKSRCLIHGGSSFCPCGIRMERCQTHGGSDLCIHLIQKTYCKPCRGSQVCIHSNFKAQCKECGDGTAVCPHGRQKSVCKDCKGGHICIHNRLRSSCRDCIPEGGGSKFCIHNCIKTQCSACQTGTQLCENCKFTRKNQKYKPYCFRCYCVLHPDVEITRKFKLKEYLLREELQEYFETGLDESDIEDPIYDKQVDSGCSKRRPDVRIERFTHTIIIECDELQHKSTSCEEKRMMEIFQDLGSRPVVFLRFNPDKYISKGVKTSGCFDENGKVSEPEWRRRINSLKKRLETYFKVVPEKELTVEHLFYDDTF